MVLHSLSIFRPRLFHYLMFCIIPFSISFSFYFVFLVFFAFPPLLSPFPFFVSLLFFLSSYLVYSLLLHLQYFADVKKLDTLGRSALWYAKSAGSKECADILRHNNCNDLGTMVPQGGDISLWSNRTRVGGINLWPHAKWVLQFLAKPLLGTWSALENGLVASCFHWQSPQQNIIIGTRGT